MSVTLISLNDSINSQKIKSSKLNENSEKSTRFVKNGYCKIVWKEDEYFEGFFVNGKRFKVGVQIWDDGDKYIGEYFNDKRHGWGRYTWFNQDEYEGSFYNDSRHGYGRYKCSNGDEYEGNFTYNQRDGFGVLKYSNGDRFEGLYKNNFRCGPGILYYKDGRQDVGFWYRNSIYKLVTEQPEQFSISQFQELIDLYQYSQYNSDSSLIEEDINTAKETTAVSSGVESDDVEINMQTTENIIDCRSYQVVRPKELLIFEEITDSVYSDEPEMAKVSVEENIEEDLTDPLISSKTRPNEKEGEEVEGEKREEEIVVAEEDLQAEEPDAIEERPTIETVELQDINDSHMNESHKKYINFDKEFPEFLLKMKVPTNVTLTMRKILDHISYFSNFLPIKSDDNDKNDNDNNTNNAELSEGNFSGFSSSDAIKKIVQLILDKDIDSSLRHSKYASLGDNEKQSQLLLSYSHCGNLDEIQKLFLSNIPPNVNVTDCNGSFSFLEATLTWDRKLINYLLDSGADINQISDEGVSALGGCILFYYPMKNFIKTSAEECIEISQTPLNFNGVRREFTSAPKSIEKNVSENDQIGKLYKEIQLGNTNINTEDKEEWDNYQSVLIENILQSSETEMNVTSNEIEDAIFKASSSIVSNEFKSHRNIINYPLKIKETLMTRAASELSSNPRLTKTQPRPSSCNQTITKEEGIIRYLALKIVRIDNIIQTIQLLLNRGANPNIGIVPFSSIFFAVKSGDYDMVKLLISKGADVNCKFSDQNNRLTPLHISVCLPGKNGLIISELLLQNGANPNARASLDESFLDKTLIEEWSKDEYSELQSKLVGGKTPLHLVCSRYDNFKNSHKICALLLQYGANPNLICNGHTALTLGIATGNDLIVDELLAHSTTNVNLELTHGCGNAICIASSTAFEHTRTIENRLSLLRRLIQAGSNMLAPVNIGLRRLEGTTVDYAYHIFNLDQRISHLPYHALTAVERELFNNRRSILSHIGMFTREAAVQREKERIESLKLEGVQSRGPSPGFVYTGAGADVEEAETIYSKSTARKSSASKSSALDALKQGSEMLARKPLFKYCYECGRSVNVKLTSCTRCKEVYFCTKLCKTKAWNSRHKYECLRIGGRMSSAGLNVHSKKADSPTPATIVNDNTMDDGTSAVKSNKNVNTNSNLNNNGTVDSLLNQFSTKKGKAGSMINDVSKMMKMKLPPISGENHPSYSYAYVKGKYVKVDSSGKVISLDANFDNYSFE